MLQFKAPTEIQETTFVWADTKTISSGCFNSKRQQKLNIDKYWLPNQPRLTRQLKFNKNPWNKGFFSDNLCCCNLQRIQETFPGNTHQGSNLHQHHPAGDEILILRLFATPATASHVESEGNWRHPFDCFSEEFRKPHCQGHLHFLGW